MLSQLNKFKLIKKKKKRQNGKRKSVKEPIHFVGDK